MPLEDADIQESVNAMPREFDSHQFIEDLMRRRPHAYVRHLQSFLETADPILQGHAAIGRRLAKWDGIEKVDRPVSPNVRGGENDNQGWRKL